MYPSVFFFFNDTATTEIYTLSLHDALPISSSSAAGWTASSCSGRWARATLQRQHHFPLDLARDRKSTRLNSSHSQISYAVFCLKKKKKRQTSTTPDNDHSDLSVALTVVRVQ